jgi:hypothetical protein
MAPTYLCISRLEQAIANIIPERNAKHQCKWTFAKDSVIIEYSTWHKINTDLITVQCKKGYLFFRPQPECH